MKSEWHIQKAKPYFSKKVRATLEYRLHFANVLSGELAKPRRRPKYYKMHPVRSQGALIVQQQPLLFSEGTHPLREGACRKKHISSEHAGVWAAFHERSYEGIATNANE